MSTEAMRVTQLLRLARRHNKSVYTCKHDATSPSGRKYILRFPHKMSTRFPDSQAHSSLNEGPMQTFGPKQII